MHDPFRDEVALPLRMDVIADIDQEFSFEDLKQLVFLVVFVPVELALENTERMTPSFNLTSVWLNSGGNFISVWIE